MSEENKTNEAEEVQNVPTEAETAAAPAAEKETPKAEAKKVEAVEEEEFDWESFEKKGFGEGYSRKKREELSAIYENTLTTIDEKKVVSATIVSINDR
ncbi:MAG: small subunit ribosomal protein S1, partial [Roseivirga sp.]